MTKPPTIDQLVDHLQLEAHPEGGFFKETWRSELTLPSSALPGHPGLRNAGTSIIYLLPAGEVSALHRVRSDELWLHQLGDPLRLELCADSDGEFEERLVGPPPQGQLQALVPAGWWQTATPTEGPAGYSLVGCLVVPGFDFEDFEMLPAADHRNNS
ncbi:cupin domain-containing protein [Persicimonas caeni]|uniref:Cupin domain-containing protein n=1 Tax=Persicimonas caeni TaxID=2292766 RepID=A0A4Y6Q054_PERCE|nr:cupin domain-containing protein [Persicimonas caeni]QDG53961.1 cupin domain-containing protein [Persicimonas caeni]QED35182.1 cupin domain-containing protein [Persicimonas caeni]